jgi:YggT family protein
VDLFLGGAGLAVFLYVILLLGRALFSWIMHFSPDWRPKGLSLITTEMCFAATDPPIRFLRGILPTVHLGSARFDLAFPVLFFGCYVLLNLLAFARNG